MKLTLLMFVFPSNMMKSSGYFTEINFVIICGISWFLKINDSNFIDLQNSQEEDLLFHFSTYMTKTIIKSRPLTLEKVNLIFGRNYKSWSKMDIIIKVDDQKIDFTKSIKNAPKHPGNEQISNSRLF